MQINKKQVSNPITLPNPVNLDKKLELPKTSSTTLETPTIKPKPINSKSDGLPGPVEKAANLIASFFANPVVPPLNKSDPRHQ